MTNPTSAFSALSSRADAQAGVRKQGTIPLAQSYCMVSRSAQMLCDCCFADVLWSFCFLVVVFFPLHSR